MLDSASSFAILTINATLVAAVIWFAKYAFKQLSKDLREHTKAALRQSGSSNRMALAQLEVAKAIERDTDISEQVLVFMKRLNGKLESAVIAKAEEKRK